MPREVAGDRVFAVRNATEDTVYAFGPGIYLGSHSCPLLNGMNNPKIKLDTGEIVWGCQCWWGAESGAQKFIAGREVVAVAITDPSC